MKGLNNTATTYRLESYKFYPRPNHFKKRLDSLLPRFKNVIGVFVEPFHDHKWVHKIDESYSRVSKPIVISMTGDGSQRSDLNRIVVVEADEVDTVTGPFSPSTLQSEGLYINVCYIAVKDTGEQGKATVQDHVYNCLHQYGNNPELYKSLFVLCELPANYEGSESDKSSFREYINGCFLKMSAQWPGTSRIVLGPDHVTLGSKLSVYIEMKLVETFILIYEYLDRFIYKNDSPGAIEGDVAHESDVEDALYDFVRNDIELAEWMKQIIDMDEDTRAENEKFIDNVLDYIAKKLKCKVVRPLSMKLRLKHDVCNTCLDVIRFDEIVRKNISSSTKVDLKKLHPISKNYEEILKQVKKDGPRRKVNKGNDYMIPRLQNDVSAALSEVETKLKKAVKQISIMGKMMFEIEGYFRLAGEPIGESQAKLPADLQKDLLKIDRVVGAGTFYGTLEVHVKDNIQLSEVKNEIDDIIRQHSYAKHYEVRTVTKEAQQLASIHDEEAQQPAHIHDEHETIPYEHGDIIKSYWPGQETLRKGTLGVFAEDQTPNVKGPKHLYVLTCAHVVDPGDALEHEVYVHDNGMEKIGVSKPKLTVKSGSVEGAQLIDIAAVLVKPDVQGNCLKSVKNEEDERASSFVQDFGLQDIEKLRVFKFGAGSGHTQGIVCSHDYMLKMEKMAIFKSIDSILLIESLPDTNTENFAHPGDSGSVVCASFINTDQPDGSVALVAMVAYGEMKVDEHDSTVCLAFPYSKGLETLRKKSGVPLETTSID